MAKYLGIELICLPLIVLVAVNLAKCSKCFQEDNQTRRANYGHDANDNEYIDHNRFHGYRKINSYLEGLANRFPDLVQLVVMNERTFEGRDVYMMKILKKSDSHIRKPSIVIEVGQHAREWIAVAANLYFMEKLLEGYMSGEETASLMMDRYNWYIIPVVNPDGYEYTHLSIETRLWRKNRRRFPGQDCVGVDVNRNYPFFNRTFQNMNCSTTNYNGESPFSEPESQNTRNLFNYLHGTVVAFLSVHTFSNLLLVPPLSFPRPLLPILLPLLEKQSGRDFPNLIRDRDETFKVANAMKMRVLDQTCTDLFVGSIAESPLRQTDVAHTSTDWAIQAKPGVYSILIELRPSTFDERGFIMPPSEIIPAGEDLYQSLYAMALNMDPGVIKRLITR